MCGIAGFVGRGDGVDLAAMVEALVHRGPDGEGFFHDPAERLFLGHRRLSIVDLSGGAQPMWNEHRSVGVVFNGEIYNHLGLRRILTAKGHRFTTDHSDTEVLVHGYEEWGEDLPAQLNGMFAFAIYDVARRRMLLARDRFGEKPLYYYERAGFFAFASELSALCRHRDVETRLDHRALQKFFAYGYLPAPNAIVLNARKLPGGSCLTYDMTSGKSRVRSYWRFRLDPDASLHEGKEESLAEELRGLLSQAVARRLMSDVPLGVFLSGGIDSASVLAFAKRQPNAEGTKSFTIGFTEPSFDESGAARDMARALGSQHSERMLSLDVAKSMFREVLAKLDEPLGDPSILPTFLLARFAREQVTVALSGDGGDELFAGYDPFAALQLARWYAWLMPSALHRRMRSLAELLPISAANMSWDFKLKRALAGLSYGPEVWNPAWMAPVEPKLLRCMFNEPLSVEEVYSEAIELWSAEPGKSILDRTLEFFTNIYLPDNILTKVDRATMMSSLESRAVFLDNDLVDFCQKLPSHFKYRNGSRKYLLKKAVAPLLPKEALHRPKKGFGMPVGLWLRSFPSNPQWASVDGINGEWVERSWRAHKSGSADNRMMLWCWLSLQGLLSRSEVSSMAA
jgi:asparagine synthase (glutamine-hydrolysing)